MLIKSVIAAAWAFACLSTAAPASIDTSKVIEGSYIIKLKENIAPEQHLSWVNSIHARSTTKNNYSGVQREYNSQAFRGYSGHFDKETIALIKRSSEACSQQCVRRVAISTNFWI